MKNWFQENLRTIGICSSKVNRKNRNFCQKNSHKSIIQMNLKNLMMKNRNSFMTHYIKILQNHNKVKKIHNIIKKDPNIVKCQKLKLELLNCRRKKNSYKVNIFLKINQILKINYLLYNLIKY